MNNMNREAEPCEDFYEFACGRYSKSRLVPENEKKLTVHKEMKHDLDRNLRSLLEQSPKNETAAMKLAQIYYSSCMDEDAQEAAELMPITQVISNLGGWSLLQNAKFELSNFKWEALAGKLSVLGVPTVIHLSVHSSAANASRYILTFGPPKLPFEKEKYRKPLAKNPFLQYYKTYMMDLLELFGAEREVIESSVEAAIAFEASLASLTEPDHSYNQSSEQNQMTLSQFRKSFNKINLDLFLNEDLQRSLSPLPPNSLVSIVDVEYFTQIADLIGRTRLQSVSDYMMWKFISSYDVYLAPRFRVPRENFLQKLSGKVPKPEWQNCVENTKTNLGMALATGYIAKHFGWEKKHQATEMVADLRLAMENTLLNADWMDESTRDAALSKLNNMKHKIGFPNFLTNQTIVLKPFAGLRLAANTFFENSLTLRKVLVRENFLKLHRVKNDDDWITPVISANTYHYFSGNEIIFPAGILQYPLFVPGAPSYVNYGAIGMDIGYEITHGFDDNGAEYDEKGNVRTWWHSETLRVFNSKKQCFIAQYGSKFEPMTERKLDGRLTVTENVADNGGLRVAYSAYQIHATRRPDIHQLPGLTNLTDDQLFFIAYANNWCEAVKPNTVESLLDTSTQSLGMFRVNVPLQNFPAFSQAFQCPIGSAMNPFEKCRIW